MKQLLGLILLAFFAVALAQGTNSCDDGTTRDTANGQICGLLSTDEQVTSYKGVPYAKPPTAENKLRFMPPTTPDNWDETYHATKFSNICVQSKDEDIKQSEDCLYLNIWTPKTATRNSPKPVLFFIHGGAFVTGSGSDPIYDGENLAKMGDIVVVTMNYRLGALGFLQSDQHNIDGNMGLLDQQLALKWVNENIANFGGDKDKITISGESAGAMSVGFHLFSMPSSEGLFRSAIMQSNPFGAIYKNGREANQDGKKYLEQLCKNSGLTSRQCRDNQYLQDAELTPTQLVSTQANTRSKIDGVFNIIKNGITATLPWTPVVDKNKDLIRTQPIDGYAPNMQEKPFIIGVNAEEGALFAGLAPIGLESYTPALNTLYGVVQSSKIRNFSIEKQRPYEALKVDKLAPLTRPQTALSNIINDEVFHCDSLTVADHNQKDDVYFYYFSQPAYFNIYQGMFNGKEKACDAQYQNPCHGNELPYVFNTLESAIKETPSKDNIELSKQMAQHWINFVKTGKPNANWRAWNQQQADTIQVFNSNGGTIDLDKKANCSALWDKISPR